MTIPYKITVPSNPPAAGQYASIFAESVDDSTSTTGTSVKANARIGLTLIGKTNAEENRVGEIVSNTAPNFLLGKNISSSFGVKNTGNVHIDAVQNFKVEGLFGNVLYEDETAKIVMPEKTLMTETSWEDSPSMGIYKVTSVVTVPSLDLSSEQTTIVVVMPPLMLALFIVLFTAIIAIIIILIMRRRKLHKLRKSVA